MLIDISPPITPNIAVWPGDTRLSRKVLMSFDNKDNLELSTITSTVHLGAHADAPSHYSATGQDISERDLSAYIGPCQVIDVGVSRGERVRPEHIQTPIHQPRVLLKTLTFPDPEQFNQDFAALSPELIHWLAQRGVRLIGIDTPSVDLFNDKQLCSHQAVAHHDMHILEGLVLRHVKPQSYTLIAPPLALRGFDASPVRAVLAPLTHW